MTKRVGIYAGTFDPIHSGHLGFALQALRDARLDSVCLLPERMPRQKANVEHYGHRVAMVRRAIQPHTDLSLLELVDKRFSVHKTIPQLRKIFSGQQLVLLMGSDVFVHVPSWQDTAELVEQVDFVVSVRDPHEINAVNLAISRLQICTSNVTIVDSVQPQVSSSKIRVALQRNTWAKGLLPSVQRYARNQWLYVRMPRVTQG